MEFLESKTLRGLWRGVLVVICALASHNAAAWRGRVLNQFGEAVAGARLTLGIAVTSPRLLSTFGYGVGALEVEADEDGYFRVPVSGAGQAFVDKIEAEGHYEDDDLGCTKPDHPDGLMYVYIRKRFPADVVTWRKFSLFAADADGTAYTYFNSWYPLTDIDPDLPRYERRWSHMTTGEDAEGDLCARARIEADGTFGRITFWCPNGELVEYEDRHRILAPAEGYRKSLTIEGPLGQIPYGHNFFVRKRLHTGEYQYSRYRISDLSLYADHEDEHTFFCKITHFTNRYGSPNTEYDGGAFLGRECDILFAAQDKLDEIYRTEGHKAAHRFRLKWPKKNTDRIEREKVERRERSRKILPEVRALEEKRLAYKPIMEKVLAGEPHPPWPGLVPEKKSLLQTILRFFRLRR